MPDLEKTIRGLIACKKHWCAECLYAMPGMKCCGRDQMFDDAIDAIALLKAQDEGVTPTESTTEQKKFADRIGFAVSEFWCGACYFNLVGHPKFCPNCGRKVKWDV